MNEKISINALLEKYKKMYNITRKQVAPYDVSIDFESFLEFFKGIDCTEYNIGDFNPSYVPYVFSQNTVEDDKSVIAFIDNTKCCVNTIDKNLTLDLRMSYGRYEERDRNTFGMSMRQATPDGIYWCVLHNADDSARDFIVFNDNESLKYTADQYNISLDELKKQFVSGKNMGFINTKIIYFSKNNIVGNDMAKMANIIYKNGLPVVYQIAKNGEVLEMTDRARKYFELSDEEKQVVQNIKESMETEIIVDDEVVESKIISSNEEKTDEEKQVVQNIKEPMETEIIVDDEVVESKIVSSNEEKTDEDDTRKNINVEEKDVIELLINLKNMGVELSSEQELMIKVNSEKFKEYKKNSDARLVRQQEIRKQVIAENEKKAEWFNSPENPTNIRIEELKYLKRQIQGLDTLQKINSSLLTKEQIEFLENGQKFLEMIDVSNASVHEVDTGMSPEIRQWYQDNYGSQEISGKSK